MEHFLLVALAYVVVLALVIAKVVAPWALLVLLSLPPAVKNLRKIGRARLERTHELAAVDVETAKLHFLFGVLFSAGLLLSALT